jgi:hypothetical protein
LKKYISKIFILFIITLGGAVSEEKRQDTSIAFSGQVMARTQAVLNSGVRIQILKIIQSSDGNDTVEVRKLEGKSIFMSAFGSVRNRSLQIAFFKSLKIGQVFPVSIKIEKNGQCTVKELSPSQIEIARRTQLQMSPSSSSGGKEVSPNSQLGNVDFSQTQVFRELQNNVKRLRLENKEMGARIMKLESRLSRMEILLRSKK